MSYTIKLSDAPFDGPIKFIIKATGSTPDEAFDQAKKWHFPDKNIIKDSIIVRQINDSDWEVEGIYHA